MTNDYWLSEPYGSARFADEVLDHFREYRRWLEVTGLLEEAKTLWLAYHGREDGAPLGSILSAGQGEELLTRVNYIRQWVKRQQLLATQKPLSFNVLAKNDDSASLSAASLTKSILGHYRDAKGLDEHVRNLAEAAGSSPISWASVLWDPTAGEPTAADGKDLLYAGDISYGIHLAEDVAFDRWSKEPGWVILKRRVNRYILAKQHKAKKAEILNQEVSTLSEVEKLAERYGDVSSDYIDVLHIFAAPSVLQPSGREAQVLMDGTVLFDDISTYAEVPLIPLTMSRAVGTTQPYCDSLMLMPLHLMAQEAMDKLASSVSASHQIVWAKDPTDFSHKDLGPFSVVFSDTPPTTLQMFQPGPHLFQFPQHLDEVAQDVSGVNDAVLGQSNASDSGAKVAFQASAAHAQQAGFARVLAEASEKIANLTISVLRTNVTEPRVISIVGERNATAVKRFSGEDLQAISRIEVKNGDGQRDTPAGREQLADKLVQMGMITSAVDYITVLETGDLSTLTQGKLDVAEYTRRILETLRDPEQPTPEVLPSEPHKYIFEKAQELLFDQEIRSNPVLKEKITDYMLEHVFALTPGMPQCVPGILELTGQQPLQNGAMAPTAPVPGAGSPAEGGPPNQPPPAPAGPGPALPNEVEGVPGQPSQPIPPTTPVPPGAHRPGQ